MVWNTKRILRTAGPGFIIASVVLGPGSVTVASKIGSTYGYALMWILVASAICMGIFTTMAGRFGVSHDKAIVHTIADTYGRWFAVLIGISAFFSAASFQFGNNLGIATGMQGITGIKESVWPFIFTPFGMILVLWAKNLYKILEKLMMTMVMIMILAFFINLAFAKPNLVAAAKGFIPLSLPANSFNEIAALVGTTFVLHACIYQAYLVQDKGWNLKDLRIGRRDTIAGIAMLSAITILIIMTSAAALHPKGIQITSAADMAIQLEALFGRFAKYIFSLGLCAAAFSSLLVNAVMAGCLLSDGLGLGRSTQEKAPKIFTIIVMFVGMIIAVLFRGNVVYALILAQASSLFAVPSIGIGLFLLLNNKKIMGKLRNNLRQNIIAVFGLFLILIMVYYMYRKLIVFITNL